MLCSRLEVFWKPARPILIVDEIPRLPSYRDRRIQIQPRGGRTTTVFQKSLMDKLAMAGADILPITVDSNTRLERYREAEELYRQALRSGVDTLNGYPFVAIPNEEISEMISSFSQPISLRHGSPIADRLVLKAIDCGLDEIEGGPLTYSLPYTRNTPLELSIKSWGIIESKCADTLTRAKQPIMRESFGVLTAVLVPPYIAILVSFLEAIFSSRNGVRHFMIGLQSCGNISQDIVQFEAARNVELVLIKKGLLNANIYYAYHHWMGPFPKDSDQADSIIDICNLSAHLVRADKVVVKTSVEAFGVPSEESNVRAVKRTADQLKLLESRPFHLESDTNFHEEINYLSREVLSTLIDLVSHRQISEALIYAVNSGEVDLMFSPHNLVKRQIEVCRDEFGWIRLFKCGKLSVSSEFTNFEKRFIDHNNHHLSSTQITQDISWPRNINMSIAHKLQTHLEPNIKDFSGE
jgi:methylaspartate mutase epsilon subunit